MSKDKDWPAIITKARETAESMTKPSTVLDLQFGKSVRPDPHSSLGGQASMAANDSWPEFQGKPMFFLGQINFAEMPPLPGYPETGLLAFFIGVDDAEEGAWVYGCECPSRDQNGFLIRWYPDPSGLVRKTSPADPPDYFLYGPKLVRNGVPLVGRSAPCPLFAGYQFEALTDNIWIDCPDDLWNEFHNDICAQRPGVIYFGGHPDFTQLDFRSEDEDAEFSEVLLQMGHLDAPEGWEICWGDAGEACFLITPTDLANRNFKRAVYHWDCG